MKCEIHEIGGQTQHGVLSLLFIMLMDDITKFIDEEKYKVKISFYKLVLIGLVEHAFTDDLTVCAAK